MTDFPLPKTVQIKKRLFQILLLLLLALPPAYILSIYHQSSRVMYFGPDYAYWLARKNPHCTPGKRKHIYADLRPGQTQAIKPVELSCEAAFNLPKTRHNVQTDLGMKVHYVHYQPQKPKSQRPLLLYVPGITGNYMTGARYYKLAERLNFELVVMELSNHGLSEDNQMGAAHGCREKSDILAVFEDLAQNHPQRSILLAGSSMGSASILNAGKELSNSAYRSQLIGVALENPPSSVRDVLNHVAQKEGYPLFMVDHVLKMYTWRTGFDLDSCAGLKQAASFPFPALIQIARQDDLTPLWMSEKIYQALPAKIPKQLKIYPHGSHSAVWNGQPENYEADLKNFWQSAKVYRQAFSRL